LGTDTRLTLSYYHLQQDNVPDYGLPWVPATNTALPGYQNEPPPVDFSNFYGLRDYDYEHVQNDLFTVFFEHDFSDTLRLQYTSRWGRTDRDSAITAPRFAGNTTTINRQLQRREMISEF